MFISLQRYSIFAIFHFSVKEMLTKSLDLDNGKEHPLPWYPPFCVTLVPDGLNLECCDHLLGVQRAKQRGKEAEMAEIELKPVLTGLLRKGDNAPIAEIGQRINTAMKDVCDDFCVNCAQPEASAVHAVMK